MTSESDRSSGTPPSSLHSSGSSAKGSCQFQKLADQFFRDFSRMIARWPLLFCVFPVAVTIGLGSGVYLNRRVFDAHFDSVSQVTNYLPENADSIRNWRQLVSLFDFDDETPRGVYDIMKRSYAYTILVDRSEEKNMLTDANLKVANQIVKEVKKLHVRQSIIDVGWQQLCYKLPTMSNCLEHPLMLFLNVSTSPKQAIQGILRYPTFRLSNITVDNSLLLGSVIVDERGFAKKAKALRLPFVLQNGQSPERKTLNYVWQKEFVKLMKTLKHPSIDIFYSTSMSLAEQIDMNGKMLIQYLPVVFGVLLSFSVFCCCATDWVLSQPWLGLCGILTAAQAVIAAVGILLYCGFPFLQMVFIMPFLILSVSADNAFLVLSGWRNTHPLIPIEERVAQAVGGTAVSIMITALTDGLSFAVGSVSQFPAVRLFCTYCALAILCAFVYQMTFFTACLALCGRREAANRHCMVFVNVQPKSESGGKGFLYQIFCAGGYFSSNQKRIPLRLHSHLLTEFVGRHLGAVLCSLVCKCFIVLLYLAYISTSIWGVMNVKIGLQMKNLVPYDSYVAREREISDEHFSAYGPFAFVVITEQLDYQDEFTFKRLLALYRNLIATDFTSDGEFWLNDFATSHDGRSYVNSSSSSLSDFMESLRGFLDKPDYKKYRSDFKFDTNFTSILATKFYVRLRNVGSQNATKIATELRKKFARFSIQGFIFESMFLLVDQEEATIRCVLQDVFIAVAVMIAITLLFIPKLICALWIGLSILSINVGVIGYLSMWNVRLDIVSMITTVMSVGLSVDYVAHVTYHYLVVHTADPNLRMHKTLRHVAVPTIQSGISTVLGISILAFVESYMIRTFVKTVVLVVSLGVLHGLLFLPVALSLFIPADQFLESFGHYDKVREYLATNLNLSKYFGVVPVSNKRMNSYFVRSHSTEDVVAAAAAAERASSSPIQNSQHPADHDSEQISATVVQSTEETTTDLSSDLYGFLKSKNTKKTSWTHHRSYSAGKVEVKKSVKMVYCIETENVQPRSSPDSVNIDEMPSTRLKTSNVAKKPNSNSTAEINLQSISHCSSDESSETNSTKALCTQPRIHFPPPPFDQFHVYDSPTEHNNNAEKKLRHYDSSNDRNLMRKVVEPSASFKRHQFNSEHIRPKVVQQVAHLPSDDPRRSFTQSEMVQIVLNGNLGSRSALTKSFSLDNIDKSLQSLADSDHFGVVKVDETNKHSDERPRTRRSVAKFPTTVTDLKTFKSSDTKTRESPRTVLVSNEQSTTSSFL